MSHTMSTELVILFSGMFVLFILTNLLVEHIVKLMYLNDRIYALRHFSVELHSLDMTSVRFASQFVKLIFSQERKKFSKKVKINIFLWKFFALIFILLFCIVFAIFIAELR